MTNIITAAFGSGNECITEPVYQHNYGQILKIEGVPLPEVYEVHFSNQKRGGKAKTSIGNADGVVVPDQYLLYGAEIYAWVFLHQGPDDGETVYMITIPVIARSKPSDQPPTPVQQSVIDQAIAALNSAVAEAEEARDMILGMSARATTLPPGSDASASYNAGVMSFGIPRGDKGEQGDKGEKGNVQLAVLSIDLDSGNLICTPTDEQDFEFVLTNDGTLEVTV